MEIYEASVSSVVRALVVSARRAARSRRLSLERASRHAEAGRVAEPEARVGMLEDAVAFREARLEVLEQRWERKGRDGRTRWWLGCVSSGSWSTTSSQSGG